MRETTIHVLDNNINKAIMVACGTSLRARENGSPVVVLVKDGGKHILTIREHGDIEEVLVPPMRVGMVDRLADCAVNSTGSRQRAALDFARRLMGK